MQVELSSPSISRPQAAPFDILLGSDLQLEVALVVPALRVSFLVVFLAVGHGAPVLKLGAPWDDSEAAD